MARKLAVAVWYLMMGRWTPLEEIDAGLALKVGKMITSVGPKGLKQLGKTSLKLCHHSRSQTRSDTGLFSRFRANPVMKTKYNLFRRGGVFYTEDSATGKQTSLRTKDETEAKSLLNARNEAQRQPVLNLHLARAYLTASDPAFVERTWQTVMEQLQSRGKDSSRERYASVFKSSVL
jgi:hypothetical protein